jgi:hypothetical protein
LAFDKIGYLKRYKKGIIVAKSLGELQQILFSGQKLSMQGSYARRAPDKKGIPFLLEARKGLREYIISNANDSSAYRLLSQAEECLLNFREALIFLKKAINLSSSDRKDLKRMALLKEYEDNWDDLILTSDQIKLLNDYLDKNLRENHCEHNFNLTKVWLENNFKGDKNKIIKSLQNHGGFCDCEVLYNVTS